MLTKALRILGILFLCSICFFPLLRFVAPLLSAYSLTSYILVSAVHAIVMIVIAVVVTRSAKTPAPFDKLIDQTALFLFLSGVLFVVAFGMGAPPRDASIFITNGAHEATRSIALLLSASASGMGLYFFSVVISNHFSKVPGYAFLILSIVGVGLTLYDFYWGLVVIPKDIQAWSEQGKDMNLFFNTYDMKNMVRGTGRCLIYLASIITFLTAWKLKLASSWVAIVLSVISIFLLQDVLVTLITDVAQVNSKIGMVPAIALSPLYLLGVYWLAVYKNHLSLSFEKSVPRAI